MKRILTIGVILLFIGSISSSTGFNEEQSPTTSYDGKTLYVGGSGPNNYSKIQDAIDDASDGDTVFVYNGTYGENVVVHKSINLIGEAKENTKIASNSNAYDVLILIKDNITVMRFTIQRAGYLKSGIWIASSNNKIIDCNICNNADRGIFISDRCNNNLITQCNFYNNDIGLCIRGFNFHTYGNIISFCTFSGNEVEFGKVKNILITDCVFSSCKIIQYPDVWYSRYDVTGDEFKFFSSHNKISNVNAGSDVRIVNCDFLGYNYERIRIDVRQENLSIHNCTFVGFSNVCIMIYDTKVKIFDISHCTFYLNIYGIYFYWGVVEECSITNCKFTLSREAINFGEVTGHLKVTQCHFEDNELAFVVPGNFDTFSQNNFIKNIQNVATLIFTFNFYKNNYWDDWRGFGPYRVGGGFFNWDWHPAQEPYPIEV